MGSTAVAAGLLLVFVIHLVAFAVLGLRRREPYYGALVVTFTLLSAAAATAAFAPDVVVSGGIELHSALRAAAWPAAAVSIGWTLLRVRARRARRRSSP